MKVGKNDFHLLHIPHEHIFLKFNLVENKIYIGLD